MTKQDRVRAFGLRSEGLTWEQIGEILGYSGRQVSRDLHRIIDDDWKPRKPKIVYPKIAEYVNENCFGSIEVFANEMKVSPYRLRRVLVYGDRPTDKLTSKIVSTTKINEKELYL